MPKTMKCLRHIALISLAALFGSVSANAEDTNAQALALITDTAAKICQVAPLTQHNSHVELSGNAKTSVNGVIGKLVAIGVDGAAKYNDDNSNGVLQQDLIAAIKEGNNCKLQVFNKLVDKILNAGPSPEPVHGFAPSVEGISLGSSENILGSLVSYGSPPTYATNSTIRIGVGFSKRPVHFEVYFDTLNGKVSKIRLESHASVNCLASFGKSALDDALEKFGQPRTDPSISSDPSSSNFVYSRYFFSNNSIEELLTIVDKTLSPGNETPWCKVQIQYRPSS